jgi:alkylation response protein AidB-like acyl-CoA dehydrogenase
VTEQAIQILGGVRLHPRFPRRAVSRDSKIYTLFEGASEIHPLVVALALSGLHIPRA